MFNLKKKKEGYNLNDIRLDEFRKESGTTCFDLFSKYYRLF